MFSLFFIQFYYAGSHIEHLWRCSNLTYQLPSFLPCTNLVLITLTHMLICLPTYYTPPPSQATYLPTLNTPPSYLPTYLKWPTIYPHLSTYLKWPFSSPAAPQYLPTYLILTYLPTKYMMLVSINRGIAWRIVGTYLP